MTDKVVQYLQDNREALLNRLYEFLSIPSVSTDSEHKEDVKKGAQFVADYLTEIGFDKVEVMETDKHPLVFGEWMKAEGAPTALFYGHYDVQPADPYEEWKSEPFKPEVRNERIYARGSSDDKGQVFMHLAVFEAFMNTTGELPLNVKVCIEGEEEIGSENLTQILKEQKDKFAADFSVISDSGMVEQGQPTITYGLKGFTGLEFTLNGPSSDLHSGMYGGAVRNPAMAMAHLLTSLKNEEEVVTVDGFYDGVEELSAEERKLIKEVPGEDFVTSTGVPETTPEKGFTAKEHTMARPTMEINGLYSGYQGEGTKTIIPSAATAKITCRLVPGQDPDRIQDLIVNHLETHVPAGVTIEITREPLSAKAYKVDPEHPLIQKAAESFTKAFEKETVFVRMGGSIPVVELIDQLYKHPVVLLGFGTPEDGLHSPNESFPLESFDKGMETIVYYWNSVSKS
ncbi:dipeptidase [Virgibacillus sp. MSP4-1]|uniref:dipeptidase n=1 Tax=Virgibacillus sp. MSP4-1 TaxID=2700081 RepID=UPI0003A61C19|nr:dipeptidase [Virgibacillus sp. MSP4-1]QHS22456.1 dipeptidase [Virgibacillus sp. MSP4-1]